MIPMDNPEQDIVDDTGCIDPRRIRYNLAMAPTNFDRGGALSFDPERQVRAAAPEWIKDHFGERGGDCFRWDHHGHSVPMHVLERVFTPDEVCQIWHASYVSGSLDDFMRESRPLFWKLANIQWRYAYGKGGYNGIAGSINALARLDFGVPGFETRLTHTWKSNLAGWSEHYPRRVGAPSSKTDEAVYLDAALAMVVYHKGEHVLTVGFALGERGVLLTQCQLRQKKGNRWLYRLPAHYLDASIAALAATFERDVWLVEGGSAAAAVRRSYGSSPCNMTPEVDSRITNLYNRPLADYDRTGEETKVDGRVYMRLQRRDAAAMAAE